jgi:hypothetical protein
MFLYIWLYTEEIQTMSTSTVVSCEKAAGVKHTCPDSLNCKAESLDHQNKTGPVCLVQMAVELAQRVVNSPARVAVDYTKILEGEINELIKTQFFPQKGWVIPDDTGNLRTIYCIAVEIDLIREVALMILASTQSSVQ